MSTTRTKTMLESYTQVRRPTYYLSSFFQTPASNFYNTEEVQLDCERSQEDVAIAIQDRSTGYRANADDVYTNKSFKAPIYKESITVNSFDIQKRQAGDNPFKSLDDMNGTIIGRAMNGLLKVEKKIKRAIELQASQVLQTGIITLTDANGVALYELDYRPKATHFPTAGTSWATASGEQKLADIAAVADVIRSDGLATPDTLIMGQAAFDSLMRDSFVQSLYDNRAIIVGHVERNAVAEGGQIFQGTISIGPYRYDIYTYPGLYTDPQSGVATTYVDSGKIIVRASSGRFDATYGAVPNVGALLGHNGQELLPSLGRFSDIEGGIDLYPNAWLSADGNTLFAGVSTRPLLIPTAIDTYGCLDTQL